MQKGLKMIFEKLEYQQKAIENILNLLENFDFKALKAFANGGGLVKINSHKSF